MTPPYEEDAPFHISILTTITEIVSVTKLVLFYWPMPSSAHALLLIFNGIALFTVAIFLEVMMSGFLGPRVGGKQDAEAIGDSASQQYQGLLTGEIQCKAFDVIDPQSGLPSVAFLTNFRMIMVQLGDEAVTESFAIRAVSKARRNPNPDAPISLSLLQMSFLLTLVVNIVVAGINNEAPLKGSFSPSPIRLSAVYELNSSSSVDYGVDLRSLYLKTAVASFHNRSAYCDNAYVSAFMGDAFDHCDLGTEEERARHFWRGRRIPSEITADYVEYFDTYILPDSIAVDDKGTTSLWAYVAGVVGPFLHISSQYRFVRRKPEYVLWTLTALTLLGLQIYYLAMLYSDPLNNLSCIQSRLTFNRDRLKRNELTPANNIYTGLSDDVKGMRDEVFRNGCFNVTIDRSDLRILRILLDCCTLLWGVVFNYCYSQRVVQSLLGGPDKVLVTIDIKPPPRGNRRQQREGVRPREAAEQGPKWLTWTPVLIFLKMVNGLFTEWRYNPLNAKGKRISHRVSFVTLRRDARDILKSIWEAKSRPRVANLPYKVSDVVLSDARSHRIFSEKPMLDKLLILGGVYVAMACCVGVKGAFIAACVILGIMALIALFRWSGWPGVPRPKEDDRVYVNLEV